MDTLGPVVQRLGSILKTGAGRARMIVVAILCAVALFCFGTGGITFVSSLVMGGYGPGEQAAVLLIWGALGLLFAGFAVIFVVLLNRTRATIHAQGLQLTQTFFSTHNVLWRDVAHVEVPKAHGRWVSCHIVLWSGRRVLADRLGLRSREGPNGTLTPHPDVQIVLSHLAAWRRAHGRPGPR